MIVYHYDCLPLEWNIVKWEMLNIFRVFMNNCSCWKKESLTKEDNRKKLFISFCLIWPWLCVCVCVVNTYYEVNRKLYYKLEKQHKAESLSISYSLARCVSNSFTLFTVTTARVAYKRGIIFRNKWLLR